MALPQRQPSKKDVKLVTYDTSDDENTTSIIASKPNNGSSTKKNKNPEERKQEENKRREKSQRLRVKADELPVNQGRSRKNRVLLDYRGFGIRLQGLLY